MTHTRQRYQNGSLTTELRKQGPDVYVFRWREKVDGRTVKRKSVLGTVKELTKTQAQRKADLLKPRANAPVDAVNTSLTVADLANHYRENELGESSVRTIKVRKAYLNILANYVVPTWGKHSIFGVKAIQVESWLRSLDRANGTKAKIREVFGATFRHGIRHELCRTNPIAEVRQARKRASEPDIIEPFEVVAILRELDGVEPVRTAFLIAALTGLRRGELFGLQWQDVDFDRAVIHIRRSMVDGVEGPPKTDSSRRPIPMPEQVSEALHGWRTLALFIRPTDWVFASENSFGKLPLWPGTLWRRNIGPAIDRAGIQKKLGWHSLRRSYASLLLATGASLRVSMELMRHSTAEMTLATYAQSIGTDKRDAGSKVATMMLGAGRAA